MKNTTLAQGNQILNLILQKEKTSEEIQDLFESGLLADILDVKNPKKIDRNALREMLGLQDMLSIADAEIIMGNNFISPHIAIKAFGLSSTYDAKKMSKILSSLLLGVNISSQELITKKDTHILFPGFPMTILDIRDKAPKNPKTFYGSTDIWYNYHDFAQNERVECRWHLIQKEGVKNSRNKDRKDQLALLSEDDEVPTASAVVYTIVLYYLVTGKKLFTNYYVRTASIDSDDCHVNVGKFDSVGLSINSHRASCYYDTLGLAVARKFKK